VHLSSKLVSQPKLRRCLPVLAAIYVLIGAAARAQNLDQGKSATRLFADSCATCHRSARGLARGRFHLSLFLFLREHYASNSSAAWELTSYLESVDRPQNGRSRAAAVKPSRPATWPPRSPIRPPMPIPLTPARSNLDGEELLGCPTVTIDTVLLFSLILNITRSGAFHKQSIAHDCEVERCKANVSIPRWEPVSRHWSSRPAPGCRRRSHTIRGAPIPGMFASISARRPYHG
jgi:hypothetical protein